ncbi:MAG TPA: carotenoid biosynthesis protein [Melioribacteraceae bacterium]|nr:carotenoid biosynthesis protein [Melioribacteraceae bacterium]
MEGKKNIVVRYATKFLYIIFAVGVAGHLLPDTRELMLLLTPFTLVLTIGVVFYSLLLESNRKLIYWLAATYLFTLTVEIAGVKTGQIFGQYSYGRTLGSKLFDVPLIIGLNWVFVILGGIIISKEITSDKNLIAVVTGLIAVVFDLFLEPVAMKLDYWNWLDGEIPFQNYAAWFVIAFIVTWLFSRFNLHIKTDLPKIYLLVQFVFFISLFLFL